jgi:ubiquinone/menaquinone biosynthesis C-methylase UbiE
MQIVTGGWAAAILGSAARFGIFNALENGGGTTETVAQQAGISQRGAQALLDGLTGVGLLTHTDGRYYNTPDASAFLIKGKPSYFGGMAEMFSHELRDWAKLGDAVKTGQPAASITTDVPNNEFWQKLVPAIAALSLPVAQMAAERLGIADAGAVRWLDVGGGSGVWSAVWLQANPRGAAYQLDWPVVNTIAKDFVAGFGVAGRFHAIDGDFHEKDFGDAAYDYAIYAHIAHQETPEDNVAVFRKFRRALKPGGTLVINDFVLADDRTGPAFAMLFASQMLLGTKGGVTWRHSDYRSWLTESGFTSVEIVHTPTPATLVFAK